MQYAAVYDLLAVLIFSAATAFCAAAWGRSGRREMQSAGFFCAALTVDAAFSVGQSILGCSYSTSSVALTAILPGADGLLRLWGERGRHLLYLALHRGDLHRAAVHRASGPLSL